MNEFRSGKNVCFVAFTSLVVVLMALATAFASEYCAGGSEVDSVPSFINHTYLDVLGRRSDKQGQTFWTSRLADQNRRACRSANPDTLAGNCEWNNAAQIVQEMLNTPESRTRNGAVGGNSEFVTVLYKTLLHRAPEPAGLNSHLALISSGQGRPNIILTFLLGQEYRQRFSCLQQAPVREQASQTRTTGAGHAELGVNGHPMTQPPYSNINGIGFDQQLTLVQNLGAKWYRFDVSTQPDFATLDLLIKAAQAHGVRLLPILFPGVDKAHDDPATAYRKSYDRALSFVNHYKNVFHVYELSNELDNFSISGGDGDKPSDYNPQKYEVVKEMLRGLAEGVHAGDASAQRIIDFAGWLHTGFFERLESDHIPYEIVGVHWYQDMGEITCPGQSYPCPPRAQHFNVIQRLETITHNKPIWVTETSYKPLPRNSAEENVNRKLNYLPPTLERYMNSPSRYPFEVVILYELLDEPHMTTASEQQTGLYTVIRQPDGRFALGKEKPDSEAVRRVVQK
jgi:hypothetical protein